MSANHGADMRTVFEGGEEEATSASNYLDARHIRSSITLAEDCRPGM